MANVKKSALLLFFFMIFMIKVLESLLPYDHADALYYHLAGARILIDYSWQDLKDNLLSYAQAGYFELFYIGLYFFSSNLLKFHILGQFFHFLFSLGLGSFFSFLKIPGRFGILAGISLLTISKEASFFLYAKNDGVLAFLSLLALFAIYFQHSWFQIGLILGLIVGVKLSGLFVVLPLVLFWLALRPKMSDFIKAGFLALIIILPNLIKNCVMVKNPLFPAALNLFPTDISASMLDYYRSFFGRGIHLDSFKYLMGDFFLGKVIFILAPFIFIKNVQLKNHRTNGIYLVGLANFALYLISNGGYRAARFFFPSFFIVNFFIFFSLYQWDQLNLKWIKNKVILVLIFILILIDSKIDKSIHRATVAVKDHFSLSEQEMLRTHVPHTQLFEVLPPVQEKTYILTDYLSENLYLPQNYFIQIPDHSPKADFLYRCKAEDRDDLKRYKYAIITKDILNPCYEWIRQHTLIKEYAFYKLYSL